MERILQGKYLPQIVVNGIISTDTTDGRHIIVFVEFTT